MRDSVQVQYLVYVTRETQNLVSHHRVETCECARVGRPHQTWPVGGYPPTSTMLSLQFVWNAEVMISLLRVCGWSRGGGGGW